MILQESILPFYFGYPEKQLFGCYHRPRLAKKRVIVICQPMGHEYINSHRALRRLAARLCGAGFATLRFDYYGCGDSSGDANEGSIPEWLNNISTAIAEAKRRSGRNEVVVVGLRLGATLSMMASEHREDIAGLVLWDPVVNGRSYLEELFALQKQTLRFRAAQSRWAQADGEILGFPLASALYSDLEDIDLTTTPLGPVQKLLLLGTGPANSAARLQDRLGDTKKPSEYQGLDAPKSWLPSEDGSLLVPIQMLDAIVAWVSREQG
jgi:uncharacterized protein